MAVNEIVSPGQISPFSQTIIGAFGVGVTITSTDANELTQSYSLQTALYVSETVGLTIICGPVCFGDVSCPNACVIDGG